ncbi:thioredoxin fold domain-containing protein [Rhodoferax sp.]|uniref:thioredoxin fold domain-containing protein n=1 Tax=Rhodoferax sp. TaxID=50421 RepID=UPI00262BB082|nr:thioredoxin fold domain-containing protein [Rhodoferax sp.]MDD2917726.1 thioredoxin fold domain-containing protein [Rhodoferax sp.]
MKNASLVVLTALVLAATACSKTETPAPVASPNASTAPATAAVPAANTGTSYDMVAANSKGFTVGALMSAQAVYVLFDPQCPHCGRLWQASLPLHDKVKFVWIPISFNPTKSVPQGAALLAAANPVEAMTAHEQSLLAGTGGMAASADVPDEIKQAITTNTQLLNRLGADSVPFMIGKHRKTSEIVTFNGAMETAALANFLGVE